MEIDQVKIAIGAILTLEVCMGVIAFLNSESLDVGTVGMGIAAIAGLAGYDMRREP